MDGADKYDYGGEDPQVVLQEVTKKLMDCRRRKAAANAVDLLVSLGRAGIQPDLLASTTCLGACVASGKMDLALKVFEEVFEKGERRAPRFRSAVIHSQNKCTALAAFGSLA